MPSVIRYIEAVSMLSERANRLASYEPVRNDDGELYYFSSSRSVLFKVGNKGQYYALKCFISPDEFLKERYKAIDEYLKCENPDFIEYSEFYDDELTVIERDKAFRYPVLLTPWIEGQSLTKYIDELCRKGDKDGLYLITDKVMKMFVKLMSLELIHGDIKLDNIIVSVDGKLSIIDLDGCYLPVLDVCPTTEIGTPNFRHPLRTTEHYGCRVDDYSMALIIVILIVLSENPTIYFYFQDRDYIVLSPELILRGEDRTYERLREAWRYNPLRYKLLSFLNSQKIEMPDLNRVVTRLAGLDNLNLDKESIVDLSGNHKLRRIVDKSTHLYGFIDSDNKVVVDTMYGDATSFECGMAGVRINSDWFFIDEQGRQISDIFSAIRDCRECMFIVKKDSKFGYFSAERREVVIKPIFSFASPFKNGIAKVAIDENYYFINHKGEIH